MMYRDFNFNVLNAQHSRKIEALCRQFSLYKIITEPTHFTENSSSLLDIILVSNKNHVTTSGVGGPFLDQNIRYHCPVYLESLSFQNPKFNVTNDTFGSTIVVIMIT